MSEEVFTKAKKLFYSKKFLLELSIIIFLIVTNFVISYDFRISILDVMFPGDDPLHIIIANNFRTTGDFSINYLGDYIFWSTDSTSDIVKQYPNITHEQGGKGPIYFILLSTFFTILDSSQDELFFHGSILSTIISSTFLILFYFLVKKYFTLQIAFLSSLIILFLPFFEFFSVFVRPHLLMFTFSLAALFFLNKKKSNYLFFGFFIGLAHLTHPFTVVLGFSYLVFLLLNKEIKGLVISFLVWLVVLFPWFVRNYIISGDIGYGLYIPFTNKISPLFSYFIQRTDSNILLHTTSSSVISQNLNEFGNRIPIFEILSAGITRFSLFYTMDIILIFIIFFSFLYFFKLNKIFSKFFLLYVVIFILTSIIFGFVFSFSDSYVQLILIFVIPVIFISLLKKFGNEYFKNNVPRISYFVVLFAFINLIFYYLTSVLLDFPAPDPYQLMLSLFLLIPISIISLKEILYKLIFQKINKNKKLFFLILFLIISPILIHSSLGIDFERYAPEYPHQSDDDKSINSWIINNSHNIKNIASSNMLFTTSETSISSIPILGTDFNNIDTMFNFYNVSHIVFYGTSHYWNPDDEELVDHYTPLLNPLRTLPYVIEPELLTSTSMIFSIHDVMSSDISHLKSYLGKAKYLEKIDPKESFKIYSEIHSIDFTKNDIEILCDTSEKYAIYDELLFRCTQLLELDSSNEMALENLLISYLFFNEPEKFIENYINYIDWTEISNSRINFHMKIGSLSEDSWTKLIKILKDLEEYDYAIAVYDSLLESYTDDLNESKSDSYYSVQGQLIETFMKKRDLFLFLDNEHYAQKMNLEIISIDKTNLSSWLEIARYHEKYENWSLALHAYEFSEKLDSENDLIKSKIEQLKLKMGNN